MSPGRIFSDSKEIHNHPDHRILSLENMSKSMCDMSIECIKSKYNSIINIFNSIDEPKVNPHTSNTMAKPDSRLFATPENKNQNIREIALMEAKKW